MCAVGHQEPLGLELIGEQRTSTQPDRLGHAAIAYVPSAGILTRATGFMSDYDYTLNPYSGCSFGCTYCYAAFFASDVDKVDNWGRWVEVKENALLKLRRMRTPLAGKRIYMSSVTDPYQPIERRLGLVRELLLELAARQVRLVVQTRSPLLTRDADVFKLFKHIRVNMTVTTDMEVIRREFEPWCPTTAKRLDSIAHVASSGIPTSITLTPLLPLDDPVAFAEDLLSTGVNRFVVQPFHGGTGRFVAGTGSRAMELLARYRWDPIRYREAVAILRSRLPRLDEGRAGFEPA
jgi:DNA repair photolyase